MTEAEVRRYLLRYRIEKKKIRRIEEQIQELRESKESAKSPVIDALPKGQGGGDLSGYAARIDELERELMAQQQAAREFLADTITTVNRIEVEREREILTLYYIRGKRWEDICFECGYSWRQVFRIRKRAFQSLREILDDTPR